VPEILKTYFCIGLGGAFGSIARFWLSGVVAQRIGETFPWGTLLINISGSFLIGLIAALADPAGKFLISPNARQFLLVGVCGGYTTFSSFSLQTLNLARDGEWLSAGANILCSVALCLIAVWFGYFLGEVLNR
jgi:CrcB protein